MTHRPDYTASGPLGTKTPGHPPRHSRLLMLRLAMPERDAPTRQIVRRKLDDHAVSRQHPDVVTTHAAAQMTEHMVAVLQLNREHRVWKCIHDLAFDSDRIRIHATRPAAVSRNAAGCPRRRRRTLIGLASRSPTLLPL